jgi:hypothetical protein
MSVASKTLNVLVELGRKYYTRPVGAPGVDPFYTLNDKEMSITLKRRGEQFDYEWLERAKKTAKEDGYPTCTVGLNRDGHLKVSFTR